MQEPTLDWLRYRVHFAPGIAIDAPTPRQFDTPQFLGVLTKEGLELKPKVRIETQAEARAAIEPLLRAWEVQIGLDVGTPVLTFEFEGLRFVDGASPSGSGFGLHHSTAELGPDAFVVHHLKEFPPPPKGFVSTPDIETLWFRFRMYKQRREPLQSMAYFCLTVLKASCSGTDGVARILSVDKAVLRKISDLSTNTGDSKTARKRTHQLRVSTAVERHWLEAAILALIRHMGEVAAGNVPTQLRMTSLPAL